MDHVRTAHPGHHLVSSVSLIAMLFLFFATGCDAPRDNTLDPRSPEYNPLGIGAIDNEPDYDEVSIYVIHDERDQGDVTAVDRVVTFLQVRDFDGIEFVQLEIADTLRFTMEESGNNYGFTFYPIRFDGSVYDFSSAPFRVVVYDKKGNLSLSEQYTIVRVLSHPPEIVQPFPPSSEGGVDVLDSRPTIRWLNDTSSFEVHYLMKLRSSGPTGEVAWKDWFRIDRDPEADDTVSYRFSDQLPADPNTLYFVTMALKDEDDNMAIGPERAFKILN